MFFFFNDPATTEIYPLSLPAALPISTLTSANVITALQPILLGVVAARIHKEPPSARGVHAQQDRLQRSEEHTSELQSHSDLVCRLLLEKKNNHTSTPASALSSLSAAL